MSTVLQVLGALLIAGGLALWLPWLGLTVLGVLMLLAGVVVEAEERNGSAQSD